uniref:MAPK activating protein n=1 Tax=Solanum tuberosum TaxID=4113 RepID=M1C1K4_SOLTU
MDFASMDRAQLTMVGSGFSALLSMHFTIQLLSQHLFFWKNPKEQKAIIMIICMAPLYAIDSFVGLLDIRGSKTFFMFLDSVKECYEAVPRTARLDHRTLKLLKHWTWQFVIIRPACSILMIMLQILGLYPSWLSWTFTIILNISFSVAMYSLVVFYHVFSKELQPHKPLSKFICIKGIVFFSFWQGLLVKILVSWGIIKSHHFWLDVEHLQEAIQNVLICVEMVFFSVMQQYAYHVAPYSGDVEAKLKLKKDD